MAAKKQGSNTNVRGVVSSQVSVIPAHVYRGIIRVTTITENRSATESNKYDVVHDEEILVCASPHTVTQAFDAVINEMVSGYANPDMVSIKLIEYRDLSTDSKCFSVV